MAVNEVDNTGVIVWTVGPGERQGRREVGVVVRRCRCSAHTGNEVSTCVGGVVKRSWWSCVHFGFVEAVWFLWDCLWASGGLPEDFRWPVNTSLRRGVLEAQDGVVVGVVWPLPSGLASGPLRTLNEHFRL